MIKTISTALAAVAVVTFAGLAGQASAQSCSSCGPGPAPATNSFSYPSALSGCGHGGCGAGHGKAKEHFHNVKQQIAFKSAYNEKIAARNDAWPKPFACWDKTGYYQVWAPMIQAGSETQAVLDSNFFTEGNALNSVGIDRVAGIVLNMPSNDRTLYVSRGPDDAVNQARVNAIRNTVSKYYGHVAGVSVRMSDRTPETETGAAIMQLQAGRIPMLPPAVLPVGTANSVGEAVTQ